MNKKIAKVPRKQPGQNSTKWNNLIRKGIRVIEDSSEQKAAQPSSVTEQNPETIDLTKEEEKKVEAVENKEPEAAEVKGKESPDDYNLDL